MNMVNTPGFVKVMSSHHHKIIWYYAKNIKNITNYSSFLNYIKPELVEKLKGSVGIQPLKFILKLKFIYTRTINNISHDKKNSSEDKTFKTFAKPIFADSDLEKMSKMNFQSYFLKKTHIWVEGVIFL